MRCDYNTSMPWRSLWALLLLLQLSFRGPVNNYLQVQPTPSSCPAPCMLVRVFPDGGLHVGDWVSLQIVAPHGQDLNQKRLVVKISSASPVGGLNQPVLSILGPVNFSLNDAQNYTATFTWAWDTHNLASGSYVLAFSVSPGGPAWDETIQLEPPRLNPPHWATAHSACCTFDYITGTAADRDLAAIEKTADQQAQSVSQALGAPFKGSIPIVLIPRVLGQGGFTTDKILVSYLDRNYSSPNFALILHHEMVHYLDFQLGGDLRPLFFVEGLAVYLSGGHYNTEPLFMTAATLPEQGLYLPFPHLMDAFYDSQHEVGYVEAAAFVQWMVNTWGWNAFSSFYRDIHPAAEASVSADVDQALQRHYHRSLFQMEDSFLNDLMAQPVNPDLANAIRLTASFFDAVRRYQQLLDPSAYFRQTWLLDVNTMIHKGIVADYTQHPDSVTNLTLEMLMENAWQDVENGNDYRASVTIQAINRALDRLEAGANQNPDLAALDRFFTQAVDQNPLASSMEGAVEAAERCGGQLQKIQLQKNQGQAVMTTAWPQSKTIKLTYQQTWSADCSGILK